MRVLKYSVFNFCKRRKVWPFVNFADTDLSLVNYRGNVRTSIDSAWSRAGPCVVTVSCESDRNDAYHIKQHRYLLERLVSFST